MSYTEPINHLKLQKIGEMQFTSLDSKGKVLRFGGEQSEFRSVPYRINPTASTLPKGTHVRALHGPQI